MKYAWLLLVPLVYFCGCGHQQNVTSNNMEQPKVEAVWNCDGKTPWEFTLLSDGTLSDVIRPDGIHMDLSEGAIQIEKNGLYTHYIWGPCTWSYDPESKQLRVSVKIDDFTVKTPAFEFTAAINDTFEGSLSEDGKTWTAEWTSMEEYKNTNQTKFTQPIVLVFHRAENTTKSPQ